MTLTPKQAYAAMYAFLDAYYQLTKSDEIGGLLGSMSMLADGAPADPAIEEEWVDACEKAVAGLVRMDLDFGN